MGLVQNIVLFFTNVCITVWRSTLMGHLNTKLKFLLNDSESNPIIYHEALKKNQSFLAKSTRGVV